MSLTHVPTITPKDYAQILKVAIKHKDNILVFGPSGAGKTIIAQDISRLMGCRLVYINLSTLERTDFQGFPVVSDDKSIVHYATAEFMPFSDSSVEKERKIYNNALKHLIDDKGNSKNQENELLVHELKEKLIQLSETEKKQHLNAALPYLKNKITSYKRVEEIIKDLQKESEIPTVVLFDEVDKAASETNQPLLEFLQFSSINGRTMNIQACILTGNLPDENAHSNNVSHAISKRCKTYQLVIDFDQWRDWAFKNNVHDYIVQFLANEPGMISGKAPDGDPTAYALPAPRTWTQAGISLSKMDEDPEYKNWNHEKFDKLRLFMISGAVGTAAATKWEAWFKYYREFDPAISELVENGTYPETTLKGRSLTDQEKLIIAIAACSRHAKEIKDDNKEKLNKITKNVYKWLVTQISDHQMAATRMSLSLSSDEEFQDKIKKHKLLEIPEFMGCFDMLNKKLRSHGVTGKKKVMNDK